MNQKKELQDIVGADHVTDERMILESYASDHSLVAQIQPQFVVEPVTMEEIQMLVKWANTHLVPLIPVSSGPPHFRGDTVPSVGGSVIVHLNRMNKILKIDRRNRVAMVQPGVTFKTLITALEKEGLAPYLPLAPRLSKSVIGSMLEREPITMARHHWDTQDPLLCLEVIFGTGDLFRTGSAAGPGTIEQQRSIGVAQMRAMGPGQTDLQRVIQGSQGTMGIVTWATLKCRLLPQRTESFLVSADSLEPLVELSYSLYKGLVGDELYILNRQTLASLISDDPAHLSQTARALPPWILCFGVAGTGLLPDERIDYQVAQFLTIVQQNGLDATRNIEARVMAGDVPGSTPADQHMDYWKLRQKGTCQELFIHTTLDRTSEFVHELQSETNKWGYPLTDMGVYIQPVVQGTSCQCEFVFPYDPKNIQEKRKVEEMTTEVISKVPGKGGYISRPYGNVADSVFRRDAETTKVLRSLKTIFDPNNIMNPGKLCF